MQEVATKKEESKNIDFMPKILGILCNWCAYAGGDLAGVSRLQYPPSLRVVRVMCTGRVEAAFIVEGFLKGMDGIWVGG
jgi:F420-non-reducing hydrogenase iron-sulfur subunit